MHDCSRDGETGANDFSHIFFSNAEEGQHPPTDGVSAPLYCCGLAENDSLWYLRCTDATDGLHEPACGEKFRESSLDEHGAEMMCARTQEIGRRSWRT